MARYLVRRALYSVFSLLGLLIIVFFLARLTGNPAELYMPVDSSQEAIQAFADQHGFNDPLVVQFGRYLGDLVHLDFGVSLRQQRSAMQIALEAYPNTLKLAVVAIVIATVLAVVVGSLAAYRPGRVFDRIATVCSLICASSPDFWIAIVAILTFAVGLRWVPTSGSGGFSFWILPVAVLAFRPFGLLVQVVRGSMVTALSSAYVKTARAKGLREPSVIFSHALRNSLLPLITVAGDLSVSLVNGAVVVETIFGWPGIGRLMIDAITQRDFPLLQACVLVIAIAVFILNVAIDVLYTLLDPRIRYE